MGYGFLEKVYQNSMYLELKSKGYKVEAQKPIKVFFKNQLEGEYFADLLIEEKLLLN